MQLFVRGIPAGLAGIVAAEVWRSLRALTQIAIHRLSPEAYEGELRLGKPYDLRDSSALLRDLFSSRNSVEHSLHCTLCDDLPSNSTHEYGQIVRSTWPHQKATV